LIPFKFKNSLHLSITAIQSSCHRGILEIDHCSERSCREVERERGWRRRWTSMIGNIGPKISSFITDECSGGFSNSVGSM
jgi:hypothetical protein